MPAGPGDWKPSCEFADLFGTVPLGTRLGNYFLARLPADHVCCWDLIFTDDKVERDTSAAAIAVCGLLEMARQMPLADAGDGLLREAVYHMPKNAGVRERVI